MRTCVAKFPTPPDPATTPATKLPVAQFFKARTPAGELVPETRYEMTDVACAPFEVNPGDDVSLSLRYEDASGLSSPSRDQTFIVPEGPDTIPPDAPGEFGEITFTDAPAPAPVNP